MYPNKLVADLPSFLQEIILLKEKNKTVVLTNGCFDLLHEGHHHLLNEAKKLGDTLIVLVNSDSSVKRLKGNSRPIETLALRLQKLAAVPAIDYLLPFEEDTPEDKIKLIIPHILVKGTDYEGAHVAGSSFAGKVVFIPLLEGYSTTLCIQKGNHT